MDKLKQAHLYQNELIPVSGKLVERYNQCLRMLGLLETKLSQFSIDGIGWSPEIAQETGKLHYLNNGDANPNGIIITPLQKGKPIYAPYHSFDEDMMKHIFKIHQDRINDITRDCAICVDFDQHIDAFYEPLDLLKYRDINIRFKLINRLDEEQKKQLELVENFKRGNNFIDEHLQSQILKSAQTFGDLRLRQLELEELYFTTESFYTSAFDGVFVLRDFITPIIVFESLQWYQEAIKNTEYDVLIFHIAQPELLEKLRDHLIVEYDLDIVVKTPRYDRIKKFLFARSLADVQHPIRDILNDKVLFKGYLNRMSIEERKKIMGVELYLEKTEVDNSYKLHDMVDKDLFDALQQPHSSLDLKHQDLIWKLLTKISDLDVLFSYWYNNDIFYQQFKTWDLSLQDWVVDIIKTKISK